MAANTAVGTYCTYCHSHNSIAHSTIPCKTPDSLVLAPALMLTRVLIVAPAPGIPPNSAAIVLPTPWPMSSWLLLCFVLVTVSATTDVSNESIDPNAASVIPEMTIKCHWSSNSDRENSHWKWGNPCGMEPMVGTSKPKIIATIVTMTSAAKVLGIFFVILGSPYMIAIVSIASITDRRLIAASGVRILWSTAIIPWGDWCPSKGKICSMIMMTPIPVINQDTTG